MTRLREFLATDTGRYAAIGATAAAVLLAGWMVLRQLGGGVAARSAHRVFIDANTNQTFEFTLTMGETIPVPSPHSGGQRAGYEAEPCYWTRDGKSKSEPTWVLPRAKVDPAAAPTFCPDCGRLVVPRNPMPSGTTAPPPTKEQYPPGARGATGNEQ